LYLLESTIIRNLCNSIDSFRYRLNCCIETYRSIYNCISFASQSTSSIDFSLVFSFICDYLVLGYRSSFDQSLANAYQSSSSMYHSKFKWRCDYRPMARCRCKSTRRNFQPVCFSRE